MTGPNIGGWFGPVVSLEIINRFFEISLKCALVFLAACLLAALSKRQAAGVRARIWALAVLGFIAVGVFSFAPAVVRISLVPHSIGFRLKADTAPLESLIKNPANSPAPSGSAVPKKYLGLERITSASRAANLMMLIWIAGVFWNLGLWLASRQRFRKRERRSVPAAASIQAVLSETISRIGLTRPVRLSLCSGLTTARTWGLRNPVISLPGDAERWSKPALTLVLEHELAHVRRRDAWIEALARPVAVAFWFHPAVFLSLRRLRAERERACDDAVLERGAKPSEYATQLLKMAARLSPIDRKSYPELALSGRDGLKGRLTAILGPRRLSGLRRRRIGSALVAGAIFLMGSLSVSSFWLEDGRWSRSARVDGSAGTFEKGSDLVAALEQALARGGWTSVYARFLQSLRDGKIKLSSDRIVGFGIRLLLDKGSFEEARSVFRLAMIVSPDSARRLEDSGDRLLEKGDPTGARACYEMMAVLYPDAGGQIAKKLNPLRTR